MIMDYEIEEEFNSFVEDSNNYNLVNTLYMNVYDYEQEYSHNDIDIAQELLYNKIVKYLKDNYPNKYCVINKFDWCVEVLTVEEARNIKLKNYENYIIK